MHTSSEVSEVTFDFWAGGAAVFPAKSFLCARSWRAAKRACRVMLVMQRHIVTMSES